MIAPFTLNTIERLSRALFAQLSSLTGVRATGTITVTAGAADAVVSPNSYLLPIVGGQQRDDLPFKVSPNPDTLEPNGEGGEWHVPAGTSVSVAIKSNIGGARHNLAAGTALRFAPVLVDFEALGTVETDMTDGADTAQLVRRVAFYEHHDTADPGKDIFAAKLGEYPALMLNWLNSEPAEGLTAGMRQGSTRGGRKVRFTRESFVLYVIVGRLGSDSIRRQEGILVMQAASGLLTDRQRNIDGEQLSGVGAGVEVNQRDRLRRGERHYIYAIRLRVNQVMVPIDERQFAPWIRTAYSGWLPGRDAPEPTEDILIVNVNDLMNPP
jgi:hypothetical protein